MERERPANSKLARGPSQGAEEAAPRMNEREEVEENTSTIPSLVVALSSALTSGATSYSFGLYGATLQKTLHLSKGQIDTISTAFFFAGLFSFFPGLCSDRFGTRLSLVTGGCLKSINVLLYWAVARQYIVIPHDLIVPCLSLLGIFTSLSGALIGGAVYKIITVSCQRGSNTGTFVGIAKGYVGLGSGLYVVIFGALRGPEQSSLDFLLMIAFFDIVVVALPGFLFLPTKKQMARAILADDITPFHSRILYASLVLLVALITGNSIQQLFVGNSNFHFERISLRPLQNHVGMAFLLVAIWLLPIYSYFIIPRKKSRQPTTGICANPMNDGNADGSDSLFEPLHQPCDKFESSNPLEGPQDEHNTMEEPLQRRQQPLQVTGEELPEMNMVQMLRSTPALLMLWTMTILVGAGTLESNNMSQMVESLGYSSAVTPASVALFSVSQAAARVVTGAMSETVKNWKSITGCVGGNVGGIPRPFFLLVASILCVAAHITLGMSSGQNAFIIGVVMAGASFGVVWPLMVLITGEVFGLTNIGGNYMFFDGVTSACGTFFLSKIVAQKVYEAHIFPSNHSNGTNTTGDDKEQVCYGKECFQMTHWIVAALAVTCIFSSIAMQYVTRAIYRTKLLDEQNLHKDHCC